jgi:hypothetical protein
MSKTVIKCCVDHELMTKNERKRQLWIQADWAEFELTPERLEELREAVKEGDRFFGNEEIQFVKLAVKDDYEPREVADQNHEMTASFYFNQEKN